VAVSCLAKTAKIGKGKDETWTISFTRRESRMEELFQPVEKTSPRFLADAFAFLGDVRRLRTPAPKGKPSELLKKIELRPKSNAVKSSASIGDDAGVEIISNVEKNP
jgi:hypothetical protein